MTYGHGDRGTTIGQSYTQAPLRLQRPFYPEGPERCQSVIVHTAGGMVGGDRLDIHLNLEPQAQAQVTTAAAAKIYRSNGPEAQQTVTAHLGAGACLEWLPQETIVFNQAQYRQQMQVILEPGAQWLGWEVTRLGRTAMGEQFLAGNWRSRTTVYAQQADGSQRPLWIDRQWLPGSPETVQSLHGLHGCPVVGSFVWLGCPGMDGVTGEVSGQLLAQARQYWQRLLADTEAAPAAVTQDQAGITRLPQGLLCRYRGHSTSRANRWFRLVWQLIRAQGSSLPAQIPRVWQ